MSYLNYRQNSVFNTSASYLQPASGYSVTAYEVGAVASASTSTRTIQVYPGHGFAVNDKVLVNPGTTNRYSGTVRVVGVTSTTVVMQIAIGSISTGDVLFNLGPDNGSSTPNYNASPIAIYSDPDGTNTITNSTVSTASDGEYEYWHKSPKIWELVRNASGTVVDRYLASTTALMFDYDSDNSTELEIGTVTPWGDFASDNQVEIGFQQTIAAGSAPAVVHTGIRSIYTFSGNATVPQWREGAFFIMRHGVSGSGGGNTDVSGSNIAVGAYNEHRGDGTLVGPMYGIEAAVTMYNTGTISGSTIGCLGSCQVYNSGVSPATITTAIGVRGDAGVTSGQGNITNVVGVEGLTKHNGTGTITTAYCFKATPSKTGGGTLTNQYGLYIPSITQASGDNYGIFVAGASDCALWVDTGAVRFRDTTAVFQVRSNVSYFGDGTDRNTTIRFDTSTSDGDITYLGSGATNVFLLTKPLRINNTQAILTSGSGSPSGIVAAPMGSIYLNTDGGTNTTLYVKESASDATGWVAK